MYMWCVCVHMCMHVLCVCVVWCLQCVCVCVLSTDCLTVWVDQRYYSKGIAKCLLVDRINRTHL